eukprot:2702840-Pyramimonas_sp.AAC.1
MLQEAPRPPQDDSKWPRSLPRRPPKRPCCFLAFVSRFSLFACRFSLFRFFASDGHPMPQDGSKKAQESPNRGPREPQDDPKSAQERPKRGPGSDSGGSRGGARIRGPLFFDRSPPRWPQEAPRRPQ